MRFIALPIAANAPDGPDPRSAPADVPDELMAIPQVTMTGTDQPPSYFALSLEGVGAGVASLTATTVTYPVETLDTVAFEITVDGETIAGTFDGASLTAQQVADQINAEALVDGFDFEVASVNESGDLVLVGSDTGEAAEIEAVSGLADVGIADATSANGTAPDSMSVTVWAMAEQASSNFETVNRSSRRFYKVGSTVELTVGELKTVPAVQGSIYLQNTDAPTNDCTLLIGLMAAPIV